MRRIGERGGKGAGGTLGCRRYRLYMTDGGTYSNDERGSVVGSQGQLVAQLPGALFSPRRSPIDTRRMPQTLLVTLWTQFNNQSY